jgi:type I restriction enzyme, S subunit
MTNQVAGRVVARDLQFADIGRAEFEKFRVEPGDLLFNRTNSFDLVGRTAIFDLEGDFVFASYLIRLQTATNRLNPAFLNFYLNADDTQRRLKSIATRAVSQSNISATRLKGFTVPVPPLDEQRKIAVVLSAVQRAVERQERLIALTAELKKALMQKLFTEGTRSEPLKQTQLGPIPKSWRIARLGAILREPLRNGHSAKETRDPLGIRTLTLTAVTRADFSLANTKTTLACADKVRDLWLRAGDIFVERANTLDYVGLAALYEGPDEFAIFPDLLVRLRVQEEQMRPKVLFEFLLTSYCRTYFQMNAKGTAGNFPKIDQGIIENLRAPVPSHQEQAEIERAARALDTKHLTHSTLRTRLEDLFRGLLHQLMTARIRVHDLDLSALKEAALEPTEAA